MKQLDLFADYCPTPVEKPAQIVAFPTDRRWSLIVDIANALVILNKVEGRRYWNRYVTQIRREMKATGISKPEIDRQIRNLARMVNVQIDYRERSRSSGH